MFNPNSLLPVMPAPGTVVKPQSGVPSSVVIPKLEGRRQFLKLNLDPQQFIEPIKRIVDNSALEVWMKSEAFARIMDFIQSLNTAVVNRSNSTPCHVSPVTEKVLDILEEVEKTIEDFPPDPSPQRFGNISFRSWMANLHSISNQWIEPLVKESPYLGSLIELRAYFNGSFGDGTRIDYGSGHELAFVSWLVCLDLLGLFTPQDYTAIVTRIFDRYLKLVRRIQRVYNLEPAGSHGVWGLDDHQFLPYLWGSAQLLDHPRIKPKSITQVDIVSHFGKDYLYLECIHFILQVKKGAFHETSPLLYDISGVPNWHKVNTGMLKMYIAEVLSKFPVVQHFLFGSLLPFEPMQSVDLESAGLHENNS